jgi:hypothetical protein
VHAGYGDENKTAGDLTRYPDAAGRGTDIILSLAAKESGGLHVILASYPRNDRVEGQALGRAGYQGLVVIFSTGLPWQSPANVPWLHALRRQERQGPIRLKPPRSRKLMPAEVVHASASSLTFLLRQAVAE